MTSIKELPPLVGRTVTPVLLAAISLLALAVIAGWQPHSLFAAGLFAIAADKLTHSSIRRKGMILVSVPLVFMFVFVILVTQMSRKSQQAQAWYVQSKDVIAETESVSADLLDAEASIRGYVITGDPAFRENFECARQAIPNAVGRMQTLVQGNPAQSARAIEFGARAEEKISFLAITEQLMDAGARDQAIERIRTGEGLRLMNDFRLAKANFLSEEQRLDAERHVAVQSAWQRFSWLLVAGSAMVLFLAVILTILFSGGISKRVAALSENAKAVAEGKPLNDPVQGRDEIAHLDQVFRDMANALQEAARKERVIFENSLDIICVTDSASKFLRMSPSSLKIWGYQPEEMIGKRLKQFLHPDEVEKTRAAVKKLRLTRELRDFENRFCHKDGSIVHMLWSAWWSETDQLVFAMARDITERKLTEEALLESEERYRLLFENNPQPVWVYDLETLAILAVNPAAILKYGYSREEFLSMTIKDIRPPEDIPALLKKLSTPNAGEVDDAGSWRHRKKDGGIIDVEITSHRLILDGKNAEIVIANDITSRKQAEASISRLNEHLEHRSNQLEQANKELEAFSYSVSHDLRAPLRAIDGFSRMLLEDYSDKLDVDGKRLLEVVRKNAQNMGQLIDDLLALSRLGPKTVEAAPIDMHELAESVVEELDETVRPRKSDFKIRNIPPASGDRALMRQVFVNLLSNAKKYTSLKEEPVIEVGGSTKNGNHIYYVKDNGAGFDMKYANKLFGVFQRLHGPEEFEGTGVGLAIVQRIIHRHGGEVWAEGKVNEGATFYFTLPREREISANSTEH